MQCSGGSSHQATSDVCSPVCSSTVFTVEFDLPEIQPNQKYPSIKMANDIIAFDPDFKGPVSAKRRCRDIFFLLLFVLFWIGMFIVCWQAVSVGNPYELMSVKPKNVKYL